MTPILRRDELAASCYRTFCYASGGHFAPWEHLPMEHQEPWLRVAMGAMQTLVAYEYRSFAEAGAALAALQCGEDLRLLDMALTGTRNRTAYEALARHLMTLFDSDTSPDVGELEASWGPWASGKVPFNNDPFLVEMKHESAEA